MLSISGKTAQVEAPSPEVARAAKRPKHRHTVAEIAEDYVPRELPGACPAHRTSDARGIFVRRVYLYRSRSRVRYVSVPSNAGKVIHQHDRSAASEAVYPVRLRLTHQPVTVLGRAQIRRCCSRCRCQTWATAASMSRSGTRSRRCARLS